MRKTLIMPRVSYIFFQLLKTILKIYVIIIDKLYLK